MKIKTSNLTGAALDWAVAKCEGGHIGVDNNGVFFDAHDGDGFTSFEPSIDWSQGGPIIEREGMTLSCGLHRSYAMMNVGYLVHEYGPTPLIAAMRCYVSSKLGDEVEIPEDLT
jgi:hypothetical protein